MHKNGVIDLLQHKHGVVEELKDFLLSEGSIQFIAHLLQFLVDKVDADLLKGIELKNLEAGDIQHSNKGDLLHGWVAGQQKSQNCKSTWQHKTQTEHNNKELAYIRVLLHMSTM